MKVDDKIRNYQSTVTGDAVKMSIDESATAHIMDVLTKLYADPELAIIREYSTNALDSHVEAGTTRPIEVTLPTKLAPFLTIRDWGIGLDADGIRDIYSQYGTSTKRNTNEAVGMLGLGCKSALSYTDQFTLTGFKDGTRTEVLIGRDEDGGGSMAIVAQTPTDEANGVKVQIPVKRENDVAAKANDFFRFWGEGTVLVNGKQPRRIGTELATSGGDLHKVIWLDDHTLLTTEVTESLVVMGHVPYPLTDGEEPLFAVQGMQRHYNSRTQRYEYGSDWNAICFVDIGEVNFAPSRESLMTTKRTKAKLIELRAKIAALRDESIRKQIAAAPDAKTAQHLLKNGMSLGFTKTDAVWQGKQVVLELTRARPASKDAAGFDIRYGNPDDWDVETALKYSYLFANHNSYARKNGERALRIDLDSSAVIFTNFDGKHLTNVKRAKLDLWCQQQGMSSLGRMVFVDELSADEKFWLSGWDIYNWEDVAAVELPKTVTADGGTVRLKGSYDIVVKGDLQQGVPAHKIADLAKTTGLLWSHGNMWNVRTLPAFREGTLDAADYIVVGLPANRIDKFCRDFPAARKVDDAAREAAGKWVKSQKPEVLTATRVKLKLRGYPMADLDPAKLDDPALVEAIRLYKLDTTGYESGRKRFQRYTPDTLEAKDPKASEAEKALAKYPLLASLGGYTRPNKEHLHLYLNAAYAAEKGA